MARKKKTIWYTFPLETVGGGERLLLEGLKWFNENGLEAHLFADGEPIKKEALFDASYSPSLLLYPNRQSKGFFSKAKSLYDKIRFLHNQEPDVIIANSQAEALKLHFYNTFSLRKVKYVCFIHGSFFQFPDDLEKYALIFRKSFLKILEADPVYKALIPKKAPRQRLLTRIKNEIMSYLRYRGVKGASAVFVLTRKAKREIELLYQHPNVVVAHGAFSHAIYDYQPTEEKKAKLNIKDKVMLFSMCRLVAKKRVDLIVESFALFSAEEQDAVLVIGGSGPERANLEALATRLGILDKVRFLGYVKDEELLDYYCSSDIFVTADNADYDITTFVALALGKKVVASSQHEFEPELTKLGLLFHAEPSPDGFARTYHAALGTNASKTPDAEQILHQYSWENYFNQIKQYL